MATIQPFDPTIKQERAPTDKRALSQISYAMC